jgi:hypothetical protein
MAEARPGSKRMTEAWRTSVGDPDPLVALAATRLLRTRLASWEDSLVHEAVASGMTWEAIGDALGVTRQAAWRRYTQYPAAESRTARRNEARARRDTRRDERRQRGR